jgi:hypothetical protein
MLDILRLARSVVELITNLGQPFSSLLAQPLVTVSLLLALYAGWHVRDEGSVEAGLQVAFVDTRAYRAAHLRELESAILQAELRQVGESDRLINQLLTAVLQHAPTAARARLAVVHDGVTGVTGTDLLRFDITHAAAASGHAVGDLVQDQPLSEWSEFLPVLLSDQCLSRTSSEIRNMAMRVRLDAMGAGVFLACPVVDIQGRMLGAIFITWDIDDHPPSGEAVESLSTFTLQVGAQAATALDLRARLSPMLGTETAR